MHGGFFDGHGAGADRAGRARPSDFARRKSAKFRLRNLYNNDGLDYIKRKPNEILAEVLLDSLHGWKSTYWKLRRRGSFDFPVLSVAAAARIIGQRCCRRSADRYWLRLRPVRWLPRKRRNRLVGRALNADSIAEAAVLAARIAKPLDNTDFDMSWRKKVTGEFVTCALRELRGDDVRGERESFMRTPST